MLKGIKVKIYPNQSQVQQIEQNIGNSRFVWNQMLNMWNSRYQNNPHARTFSKFDLNILLPTMKQEFEFLKDSEASSLQFVCETLHDSFVQFFKKTRGYPMFKAKRKSKLSFTVKNNKNIELKSTAIKLPKIGWVKARWSTNLTFESIKRVTITRTRSGYYRVSVLVESENQAIDKTGNQIGLDVGQSDLLVGSNGLRISTRKYKHYEHKLKSWQKKASRRMRLAKAKSIKLDDARNYQEARRMVAKYHEKIRNCRRDYIHKVTKNLVSEYDLIAIEDIKVRDLLNMNNTRQNNQSLAHQSWYELRTMLEYKAQMYDKQLVLVDPAYTSQDCSNCRERTGPRNDLSIREWICINCQVKHDRDINAGQNILKKALPSVS